MKQLITVLSLALAGFAVSAQAADAAASAPAKAPTVQQSKMKMCNKDAGDKKGDERKAFMKECLSAKKADAAASAPEAKTAQQSKMKTCSADFKATGKPTSERKAFMKECLKK